MRMHTGKPARAPIDALVSQRGIMRGVHGAVTKDPKVGVWLGVLQLL